MSALLAPLEQARTSSPRADRPVLRPVASSPLKLSRVGFIIFLTTLLGAGMVGILLLNTHIQQRAQTVAAAQRQADDLGHQQASLTAKVEQLRSSSDLATRAWEQGLRPNPHPVFVKLGADGKPGQVIGEPMAVNGSEMPDQKYVGADTVTAQIAKAKADHKAKEAAEKARRIAAAKKAEQDRIARIKAEKAKQKADAAAAKQKADAAAKQEAAAAAKAKSSTGGR